MDFSSSQLWVGSILGLSALGLALWDNMSVHIGFTMIYSHLDKYLTELDKVLLGFNPIFVEHMLCKIVHCSKHLQNDAWISLANLGTKAMAEQEKTGWVAGDNQSDPKCYPFPLQMEQAALEEIIASATDFIEPANVTVCNLLLICIMATNSVTGHKY
jgi:hypothetical protein